MMGSQAATEIGVTGMDDLQSRARAEYREMPGLRLTTRQASRLWGIDIGVSERLLMNLVRSGFLSRNREGAYLLRSDR